MKKRLTRIIVFATLFININTSVMSQENKTIKAEEDPRILKEIRSFLKALNSGTGKPMEQLSPAEARKVLVDAQNSVTVDTSGIEEFEKTIMEDGQKVKIHITKP